MCMSAVQSQKAVSSYFTSEQILPIVFAEHSSHAVYKSITCAPVILCDKTKGSNWLLIN